LTILVQILAEFSIQKIYFINNKNGKLKSHHYMKFKIINITI
jgi:hypothetical protein